MRSLGLFCLLIIVSVATASAQLYPFRNFFEKDGLSNQNVNSAIEDDRGLLWVGTSNSINWFDGKNFYEPPLHSSVGQLFVTNLYKDLRGAIWVMTFYDGVYRFSHNHFTHFLIDSAHLESNCNNVFDFLQLKDSSYICLTDRNVFLFDGAHFSLLDAANTTMNKSFNAAAQLDDGTLLLGNDRGLYHFGRERSAWHFLDSGLCSETVNKILITPQGIRVATSGGLFIFNSWEALSEYHPDLTLFTGENITSVAQAGLDSVWVIGKKVRLLSGGKVTEFGPANGLPSPYVSNVYCDRRGITWFCTNNGLSRLGQVYYEFDDLSNAGSVNSLGMGRDSILWIGTQGDLIYKDDEGFHSPLPKKYLPTGYVSWLHADEKGRLWAGCNSGIFRISGHSISRVLALRTTDYWQTADGTFWLGNDAGTIWRWKGGVLKKLNTAVPTKDFVDGLYVDSRKDLWVGYRNSGIKIFRLNRDSMVCIKTFGPAQGFTNFRIRNFHEDGRGNLAVGTRISGLYIFSLATDSPVFHFDAERGLKANWVKDLVIDGGAIYMATNYGIFVLTGNYDHPDIKQIHFGDDAQFAESGCLLACPHFFYIGSSGLMKYIPQSTPLDTFSPPVYFTQLSLGDPKDTARLPYTASDRPADLDYDHHAVSFQFAGIDLDNAGDLTYQYMLHGLDTGWGSQTTHNNVSYDLRPGHYTFLVRAHNENGRWSNLPATISFYIHPPFWQRWWFLLLEAIVLAGIVYLIYQYRLQNALRLEQLRNKISTDLHDDIGSTLSSISILSEVAAREEDLVSKHILGEISGRSAQLMEKMDDIVWSINPKNDTVGNLLLRIGQFAASVLEAKDIDYEVLIPEPVKGIRLNMERRQHIYLILKEAINNLIKYSGCTSAQISAGYTNGTLTIAVTDNGIGFDPRSVRPGNGLPNMQQRTKSIRGTLFIDSAPGKGAAVTLSVKMD